jgi:HEPN domain-containing protein
VKAVLVANEVDFPRIHDLGVLIAQLPTGIDLPIGAEEQELLTDYATVTRYPGEWDPISTEDAHAAVAVARRVRSAVGLVLGGDRVPGC